MTARGGFGWVTLVVALAAGLHAGCGDGTPPGSETDGGGAGAPAFDIAPFVGIWTGKTQPQNDDVIFQINSAGALAGFQATISFPLAGGTCTAPFVAFDVEYLTRAGLDFSISSPASDLVATVDMQAAGGAFDGNISSSEGSFVACGSTLTFGSGLGTSSRTFHATKCTTCSTPACRFQNDGMCDEPRGGTGLCFLGTDPADCATGAGGAGGSGGAG